jgi:hypothetical protein
VHFLEDRPDVDPEGDRRAIGDWIEPAPSLAALAVVVGRVFSSLFQPEVMPALSIKRSVWIQ